MKRLPNILINQLPRNASLPENLSIGQLIFERLKLHGKNTAQVQWETGESQTFANILEKSCRLAIHLKEQGVKEGDRISVCSENNLGISIPICASFFIGATICPVNPLYSRRELIHTFGISQPKYIFVSSVSKQSVKDAFEHTSTSPELILLSSSPQSDSPNLSSLVESVQAPQVDHFKPTEVNKENVSCILCSSGTTGLPKGVQLTETNLLAGVQIVSDPSLRINESGRVSLGLLPIFHVYAFTCLLSWFVLGMKTIVLSRFQEKAFLGAIEKYRIEYLHLVPPLMVFLAKNPLVDRYDLSSVRTILCGAAALSNQIEEDVMRRLKIENIQQGYGLTETSAVLVRPPGSSKLGSVGAVAPGVSAKVISIDGDAQRTSEGEPLGPNCKGELCFKGSSIMKGYHDDASATSAMIDNDGWLHTGDVGYYDEDGFFYIVDRVKELIKYKGYQVAPAEIEHVLLSHPAVKDAAVIGKPDEEAGELPLAFVSKKPGATIAGEEIIQFVNERVSTHKRIRGGVRFLDSIPKTTSGKILRRELKKMLHPTS